MLEGFVCFLTILIPSISTRSFFGNAASTLPDLPLSLPVITFTLSPFLTCIGIAPP
ncbi:50S ribosomal protein L24 [Listeria monocytogenes]|nr:50S ribosomal protein L24 [Listeria monocytogenes]